MKITALIKTTFMVVTLACLAGACDTFSDETPDTPSEAPKNIDGSWKIIEASRNGVEIYKLMDFSKFRLNFQKDGTYTMDNYLPFLVKKGGKWEVDDPQYPFQLIFTQEGAATPTVSALNYPVIDGKRRITLSFSPGCHSNTYTYVFEEVAN